MAELVLFHHVLGLTDGVRALAEEVWAGGHTVHTPDLFEGRTFASIADGFAHAKDVGFDRLDARADEAVAGLPEALVYAGISLGVSHAQRLAVRRPGARGAVFVDACFPVSGEWSFGPWPDGLAVQVHGMDDDEFFAHEGDLDAARELVAVAGPGSELFCYPGDRHLWVDRSLPVYDAEAAGQVTARVLEFLDGR